MRFPSTLKMKIYLGLIVFCGIGPVLGCPLDITRHWDKYQHVLDLLVSYQKFAETNILWWKWIRAALCPMSSEIPSWEPNVYLMGKARALTTHLWCWWRWSPWRHLTRCGFKHSYLKSESHSPLTSTRVEMNQIMRNLGLSWSAIFDMYRGGCQIQRGPALQMIEIPPVRQLANQRKLILLLLLWFCFAVLTVCAPQVGLILL